MIERIPSWLRNKYSIAVITFCFWMLLFHDVDVIYVWKLRSELRNMENRCEELSEKNALAHEALKDLNTNTRSLEKFARENYFMKKENEDLFLIYETE